MELLTKTKPSLTNRNDEIAYREPKSPMGKQCWKIIELKRRISFLKPMPAIHLTKTLETR